MFEIVVIGSGPAGYTAGIYAVRAGNSVLLLEGESWGGQLMTTSEIENFPGFFGDAFSLMQNMRQQLLELMKQCGRSRISSEWATCIDNENKTVATNTSGKYSYKAVIIATGASARKLSIAGGNEYWNRGISACAVCDGALPMFKNHPIAVVGGGDSACEESMFLSRFGSEVLLIVRGPKLRASAVMQKRVAANSKITLLFNTEVLEARGDQSLKEIEIMDKSLGVNRSLNVRGLFYAIGHVPNTSFEFNGTLDKDTDGYILTDNTKTSAAGVFACGDVQDKIYRQAVTAAASGCMASLEASKYIRNL